MDQERHEFLRRIMASEKDCIPVNEFSRILKSWGIPSLEQKKGRGRGEELRETNVNWTKA